MINKTILFESMKFRKGKNVTVRFGEKWLYFNPINLDVLCKYSKRFKELTKQELKYLHDIKLSNRKRLLKEMKLYYSKFNENSLITVIWFNIDK